MDKTIVGAVAAVLAVCGLTAGAAAAAPAQRYPGTPQRYPGTVTRPVLSPAEAASRPARAYLAYAGSIAAPTIDPWNPRPIRTDHVVTHFVVGPVGTATYETVQQAVNAAVRRGGAGRSYIKVLPGTYRGAVLVPAGAPPITLYGAGSRPARVSIELSLDATMSPAAYAATVNPAGQYAAGDPAWEMYNSCASKTTATVGSCASVLWSQSADFQLSNLTVRNTLLDSVDSGTHQAIAVRTDGDRAQLERVRLISRQDTAYFNTAEVGTIGRVYVRDSYFEGDTDFVYGRASAIFDHSSFHLVSSRKPANGVIFAPSTDPAWRYGFLVRDSRITADAGYQAAATGHLGRAWDAGAGATGYLPGSSPNGQCLIRNSYLGAGFDPVAPWAPAATTARPFVADLSPDRTLDDPAFNRLWEYRNYGPSASVE